MPVLKQTNAPILKLGQVRIKLLGGHQEAKEYITLTNL